MLMRSAQLKRMAELGRANPRRAAGRASVVLSATPAWSGRAPRRNRSSPAGRPWPSAGGGGEVVELGGDRVDGGGVQVGQDDHDGVAGGVEAVVGPEAVHRAGVVDQFGHAGAAGEP